MTVHAGPLIGGPNDGEWYQWDGEHIELMQREPVEPPHQLDAPMVPVPYRTVRYRWARWCWKWVPE